MADRDEEPGRPAGRTDHAQPVVFAGQPCSVCGTLVGEITLLPPEVPHPDLPHSPPGLADLFSENARIVPQRLAGGHVQMTVRAEKAASVAEAVAAGDLAALYEFKSEVAQFYCPTCTASYCNDHWDLDFVLDDQPGQIDFISATCPQGHFKIAEDRPM